MGVSAGGSLRAPSARLASSSRRVCIVAAHAADAAAAAAAAKPRAHPPPFTPRPRQQGVDWQAKRQQAQEAARATKDWAVT
jgi:hypothetical protein